MPPDQPPSDLEIRAGVADDAEALARLHLAARRAAVPQLPPPLHGQAETLTWMQDNLVRAEVWVATSGEAVVGYAEVEDGWLNSLYIAPDHQRGGIGSALLDVVKGRRPSGFALWVFESNRVARDFYAVHGLVELDHTDGSGNEEQAPDLRMAWLGHDPLAYLTSELAVADRGLRELHERRQALLSRLAALPGAPATSTPQPPGQPSER